MNRRLLACAALGLCTPALAYTPEAADFAHNKALYQHLTANHLDAALELLTHPEPGAEHALFSTHELLNYGLYNAAEKRFLQLIESESLSQSERADLYLGLARYAYERGYDESAAATLKAMEEDLGNDRYYDRELLAAQVAGRRGNVQESVDRLNNRRVSGRTNAAKYNLAMALFAQGKVREARANLDQIGREIVNNPLDHALRDQANLTLAYDYLREANGTAALPVLQRIRVDGPFSSPALLALGWAELSAVAPERVRLQTGNSSDTIGGVLGAILRPGRVDEDLRRRLGLLRAREQDGEGDLRFRRAIRAWQTLAQRDLRQTAVLEVETALPWALTQLGELDAARRYYKLGIARLQVAADRLDSAIEAVRSGRMFETLIRTNPNQYAGWSWRATELADADETWYLAETLASTIFQESLKNYRDLRQLQRRLRNEISQLERGPQRLLAPVSAERLIRTERARYPDPLFPGLRPSLQMATELGQYPRNETLEGLLKWSYRFDPKRSLLVSRRLDTRPTPASQQSTPLIAEAETLLTDIEAALPAQRALLERIALDDLSTQREAIRKYQIEARFALARLFDRDGENAEGAAQ